jgi:hypothetical protein
VARVGLLVGDAHPAVDLAGFAGDVQRHIDGVALGYRDLGARGFALVFKDAEVPGHQLGFGDFDEHLKELTLRELETGNRLIELDALERVLEWPGRFRFA